MTNVIYWIVSASLLIGIIICLRRILGSRMNIGLRYALWLLVLLRLAVPFSIGESVLSVENFTSGIAAADDVIDAFGENAGLPYSGPYGESGEGDMDVYTPPSDGTAASSPSFIGTVPAAENASPAEIAAIIWLSGSAFLALYFAAINISFAFRLGVGRKRLEKCGNLPVFSVDNLSSSCLFGVFHPVIYVSTETAQNSEMLRHVLAHENAHYRHGDSVWSLLRCLAIIVHWYNPLVWAAVILSRRDAEIFADAGAVRALGEGERERYGVTLIRLAAVCPKSADILCTVTTMNGGKKELKERIMMIAKKPHMTLAVILAVALIAGLAVGCSFTGEVESGGNPESPESQITQSPEIPENGGENGDTAVTPPPAQIPSGDELDESDMTVLTGSTANLSSVSLSRGGKTLVLDGDAAACLFDAIGAGSALTARNPELTGAAHELELCFTYADGSKDLLFTAESGSAFHRDTGKRDGHGESWYVSTESAFASAMAEGILLLGSDSGFELSIYGESWVYIERGSRLWQLPEGNAPDSAELSAAWQLILAAKTAEESWLFVRGPYGAACWVPASDAEEYNYEKLGLISWPVTIAEGAEITAPDGTAIDLAAAGRECLIVGETEDGRIILEFADALANPEGEEPFCVERDFLRYPYTPGKALLGGSAEALKGVTLIFGDTAIELPEALHGLVFSSVAPDRRTAESNALMMIELASSAHIKLEFDYTDGTKDMVYASLEDVLLRGTFYVFGAEPLCWYDQDGILLPMLESILYMEQNGGAEYSAGGNRKLCVSENAGVYTLPDEAEGEKALHPGETACSVRMTAFFRGESWVYLRSEDGSFWVKLSDTAKPAD